MDHIMERSWVQTCLVLPLIGLLEGIFYQLTLDEAGFLNISDVVLWDVGLILRRHNLNSFLRSLSHVVRVLIEDAPAFEASSSLGCSVDAL
jgi:hypothetical protein